jgi:hypothetical protein
MLAHRNPSPLTQLIIKLPKILFRPMGTHVSTVGSTRTSGGTVTSPCTRKLLVRRSLRARSIRASRLTSPPSKKRIRRWYWYDRPRNGLQVPGVVSVSDEEGFVGSLFRFGQAWHTLYLPISPSKLLVGTRSLASPVLSASEVNRTSAALSFSYLYARSAGDAELSLAQRIGTAVPFISQEELASVVSEHPWRRV